MGAARAMARVGEGWHGGCGFFFFLPVCDLFEEIFDFFLSHGISKLNCVSPSLP
jgi:hypothetical protein